MSKLSISTLRRCFILVVVLLCACSQNDGDIGPLFGLWSLNGFSEDGIQVPEEKCEGYSIRFQTNLVQYIENLPYHESRMFMGVWHISEDSLIMKFPDTANRIKIQAKETPQYPSEVNFPIMPIVGFKINKLKESTLDISHTTPDGKELRYYFKKLK